MDKIASRAFPAFGVGFVLYYAPAYCFNSVKAAISWPLFTYFPQIGVFHWGTVAGGDAVGPPMYWYGWLVSAAIAGLVLAAISLALPERATRKFWMLLVCVLPIASFFFLWNWERVWFA